MKRQASLPAALRALFRLYLLALLAGCAAHREPSQQPVPEPPAPQQPVPALPEPQPPVPEPPEPRVPGSFERAKRLALDIYRDHRQTLYCGCSFDAERQIDADSCGYRPRHASRRSRRVEWEHLVAAYEFGAQRACWREHTCVDRRGRSYGGRRCCREQDEEFRRMEADLQNLSPEVGELNAERSNFAFAEVAGEPRAYGACDFEVDRSTDSVELPPALRGDVARAYLYMHRVYGPAALPLSPAQLSRFEAWHRADPPNAWEKLRNARIRAIQGVSNPWVEP